MSHYIQANTNGRLHAATEPSITPLDRGFLYGDAIYEVWRTYDRVIFTWDAHWQRLQRSAASLHMTLPWSQDDLLKEIRRTVEAYERASDDRGDLYVRLQITRGAGAIGLDMALADAPTFILLVQPVPVLSKDKLENGLTLSVATELRRNAPSTLNPAWKTGNYLNNILCLQEAKSRGADEVVILNLAGEVTEASVCNLAFIRGGELVTPATSVGILHGITRGLILSEVAAMADVKVHEEVFHQRDLADFQEACLLSTTKDIQPVGRIDQWTYRTGAESVMRRLKDAFAHYAEQHVRAHPALKI